MGQHVLSLINKLTKREKFYFSKLYSDSKSKNFYQLYKFISNNPKTNLEDIKKKFKGTTISRNLPSELNLLSKRLLRALNIYHINLKDDEFNLHQSIQNIRILLEKEEHKQAKKILDKAKKIAEENEEYSSLVKLISLQEEMEMSSIYNDILSRFNKFEEERKVCFENIENYFEYKKLQHELVSMQYTEGIAINKPENFPHLFNNPILENDNKAITKRAKELFLVCQNLKYYLIGDYETSIKYSKKRIDYIDNYPNIFGRMTLSKAINNHVMSLINCELFDEAMRHINRLDELKEIEDSEKHIPYFTNYLTLIILIKSCNDKQLELYIETSIKELLQNKPMINSTQTNQWYYMIFIGFFHLKKFKRALAVFSSWSQETIQEHSFLITKLIRCICYLELNEYQLLESEVENMIKLNRKTKNHTFIDHFYKFLKCFLKKDKVSQAFNSLKKDMILLRNDHKECKFIETLDIEYWIETTKAISIKKEIPIKKGIS